MDKNNNNPPIPSDFFLYKNSNGEVKVEIYIFNETVWLTQDKIAQLFGVDRSVVTKHLKNIFQTAELQEDSVIRKFRINAEDGKTYNTNHYSLEVIFS